MDLYAEMKRFEIPCNTITYNTMLNAFAQTGVLDAVPHLLQDIVTYTTLVKCFCAVGDIDQALNLLQQMEEDGRIAPDEVMYNSLLDGCAKQHRSEDAWKLLKRMSAAGIVPSNYTLSIMVKLLGRSQAESSISACERS
jgi:pentatricopeptide repeat protein